MGDENGYFYTDPTKVKVKEGLDRIRKDLGAIEKLSESIKTKGQIQPIVINRDYELIAGGRRLAACIHGGISAKVCFIDIVDPLEMRELELEENLQRKDLTPSEEILAIEEIHNLKQKKFGEAVQGRKDSGWSLDDTAELLGKTKGFVAQNIQLAELIRDFPSLSQAKTKSEIAKAARGLERVVGHVVGLSAAEQMLKEDPKRMYNIEQKDAIEFMQSIENESVDVIFTDPPYMINVDENQITLGGKTGGELTSSGFMYDDSEEKNMSVLQNFAEESYRITKSNGHAFVFCAPSHFWWLKDTMRSAGWNCSERPIIWIKREVGQNNMPSRWFSAAYEMILFARKLESKLIIEGKVDWIQCDMVNPSERLHQAEKPIPLIKELLSRVAYPASVVTDPFMGSGAVIVGALELGMYANGCDELIECYSCSVDRVKKWKEKQN